MNRSKLGYVLQTQSYFTPLALLSAARLRTYCIPLLMRNNGKARQVWGNGQAAQPGVPRAGPTVDVYLTVVHRTVQILTLHLRRTYTSYHKTILNIVCAYRTIVILRESLKASTAATVTTGFAIKPSSASSGQTPSSAR